LSQIAFKRTDNTNVENINNKAIKQLLIPSYKALLTTASNSKICHLTYSPWVHNFHNGDRNLIVNPPLLSSSPSFSPAHDFLPYSMPLQQPIIIYSGPTV